MSAYPTKTGDGNSRKLDLDDACCLKSNPSLVGHVCRTHYDIDSHEPLGDLLILSHSPVPEKDLMDFLQTGVPPKGYVFVSFVEPSQGNSLIHEDDLDLVDRTLGIGEAVKRNLDDTMSGTIISSSTKCSLEPIAFRTLEPSTGEYGPLKFTEKALKHRDVPSTETGVESPPLLHNIPLPDLTCYEEFSEGDYIIYRQKLGVINQVDRDAILLLKDQKTSYPMDSGDLELPISYGTSKIISMPSNQAALKSYPLDNGDFLWSTESEFVFPGQHALASTQKLRGDWAHIAAYPLEGHVIATPALDFHVDWICPNVYTVGLPYSSNNSEVIRASALQGNASKCDFGKVPNDNSNGQVVRSDTWLRVGDRVRFRNPADATAKYQYQQIPTDQSFGHDLNIFRLISSKTEVTVQWQDLSITTEDATSLHKFTGAEDEVWPGNLVILREGVEVTNASCCRHESRRTKKLGVVQAVDSRERIASVRWYQNPDIEVLHRGNMLKPGSTLGELGDTVTDVSIYELNLYSCLGKSLDDLVLLVPETVHQSAIPTPKDKPPTVTGPCMLSFLFPITFFEMFMYLESMKFWVVKSEWFKETTTIDSSPLPSRFSYHRDEFNAKSSSNFIGRIVSMDINGIITVRLASTNNCRDICVPLERILMVIDDDSGLSPMPLPSLGMVDLMGLGVPGRDGPSIIRTYEYEGGERFDDDSSSGEWETDDEMDELDDDDYDDEDYDEEGDDNMADADDFAAPGVTEIRIPDKPGSDHEGESNIVEKNGQATQKNSESSLPSFPMPSSCPLGFTLLECSPPSDHRFLHTSASGVSGVRIKRIRKEFEILESALPPGIFVRTWESRIDLLRVMIIGPQGTPYEYAPFVIDFQFSEDYPNTPPSSFFHSWTNGQGRINPNLYEDGKICLSILGTWPTKNPEESWSPIKSTILQILVSIMGLVLVKTPFYNEAGYEALAAEDSNRIEATQYTEKAFLMTRNFIKHVLEKPVAGFEDVLAWNYLPDPAPKDDAPGRPQLLRKAIDEALAMIEHHNNTSAGSKVSEEHAVSPFVSRLSLGAVVMLRRHISALEKIESAILTTDTP